MTSLGDGGEPQITQITRDERSYAIIGAAMEVHRQLGPGYLASIYRQALAIEFSAGGIGFVQELPLPVIYKGHDLGTFRADFLCHGAMIVEIKATSSFSRADESQIMHYLTSSATKIGLLINFGSASLEYRHMISPHEGQINPFNLSNL